MDLILLQKRVGIEFSNRDLLVQALTHSSCINEPQRGYKKSNESLAWLGDALIHWVVSENIYNSDYSKEKLTELRKDYVKNKSLADIAKLYGLDQALILPEGQEKMGGRRNQKNLHTVLEALVGAMYIEQGYGKARDLIIKAVVDEQTKVRC